MGSKVGSAVGSDVVVGVAVGCAAVGSEVGEGGSEVLVAVAENSGVEVGASVRVDGTHPVAAPPSKAAPINFKNSLLVNCLRAINITL